MRILIYHNLLAGKELRIYTYRYVAFICHLYVGILYFRSTVAFAKAAIIIVFFFGCW